INFGENTMHGIYGRVQQNFELGGKQFFGYQVSYNYLSPSIETSSEIQSKYVLESLKHQLVAGVHYRINEFSFHIKNRWLQRELANAYNVADVRLNYKVQNFLLYTEITNLFNAQYKEAGVVPMPTRWFGLGVTYQWNQG
ncbi:MAG: TonB-dependent receptor, partial [Arenibacter sp.]|nr:TonB-dependent receptor [Arenibacter sp.]